MRPLRLANVVLGLTSGLLVAALTAELLVARPLPTAPAPRADRAAPPGPEPAPSASAATASSVIAARNLFSPTRSDASTGPATAAGPRPLLHGVVVDGARSRAYLEDLRVKRTFGYAVGDTIGNGRVQAIEADRVVIAGADGPLEVLVQDPTKPKPAAPAAEAAATPAPTTSAPSSPAEVPGGAGVAAPSSPSTRSSTPSARLNPR